ncbi:MAG: hypothetical protein NZU63_13965 [Gemmataceae bacterium]|nr:hypothetical protein [Gemmataceae bacterium]MDW8242907.1 hypothetical protein [Thermogemmata sp.]
MKNNDALKKHHFWILAGLVPLLVLIAVILITSGVGGAISDRRAAIEKAQKEIASKLNPKPVKLIQEMDKLIEHVASKRGDLWKANWDSQKHLYVWPRNRNFDNFARVVKKLVKDAEGKEEEKQVLEAVRLEDLKFGDPIPNNADQYAAFKSPSLYLAMYSNADPKQGRTGTGIADMVAPMQFLGGWQSVLRHVARFPERQLTSEQIWLLMEDYWVQRALLLDLKSVNDQIGTFQPVVYQEATGQIIDDPTNPQGPQNPLRRRFQSRIWEVTLEVKQRGNQRYLEGTLRNLTDRVQILGLNRSMILKVWLDAGPNGSVEGIEPVEFRIGGEYVPGRGAVRVAKDAQGKDITIPADRVDIKPDPNDQNLSKYPNVIPPGVNITRIVKVEQVFDPATVPIRRIDALALGYTDSRWAMKTKLLKPKFPAFEKEEESSGSAGATAGPPGPGTTGSSLSGPPPGTVGAGVGSPDSEYPGMGGMPGLGGPGRTTQGTLMGAGTLESVVDANRRRYVDITDQVRRMPVAMVVVVDQDYMQDVLLALANSPLRFQVTQVTWSRFRGKLDYGLGGGTLRSGDEVLYSGPGELGEGFNLGPGAAYPGSGGFGGPPGPIGTGGPGIPPGIGSGGFAAPPGPGGYGSGGYGSGGYGTLGPALPGSGGVLSEAQLTSGLIELSIYGIVSLYEKYTPAGESTTLSSPGTTTPGASPAPSSSDTSVSEPKTPEASNPMTPGPKDNKVGVPSPGTNPGTNSPAPSTSTPMPKGDSTPPTNTTQPASGNATTPANTNGNVNPKGSEKGTASPTGTNNGR